jgi:hypothetical protein
VVCGGHKGPDRTDLLVQAPVDLEEEGHDEEEVAHDDAALEEAVADAAARDEGRVVVEGYASSCSFLFFFLAGMLLLIGASQLCENLRRLGHLYIIRGSPVCDHNVWIICCPDIYFQFIILKNMF